MPVSYTYQWQRTPDSGTTVTDIGGATGTFVGSPPFSQSESYILASADVGDKVRIKVTDGTSIWYSPWTTTVAAAPVISAGSLPIGGFSPGNMFQPGFSLYSAEMAQYVAVANGHPMILRVDHESAIQDCLDNGFHAMMVVGATFNYAHIPGGSIPAYATICAGIASRWAGVTGANGERLAILEVGGNEPNVNGISPAQEVAILKGVTSSIKSADSTLLVSSGGLAPAGDSPPGSYSPHTYTRLMCDAGYSLGDADLHQVHLYENAYTRGTWNNWDRTFPSFPSAPSGSQVSTLAGSTIRELLDAHGMNNVLIMSGESGRRDSDPSSVENGFADFKARRLAGQKVGPFIVFTMRADWAGLGVDAGFGMLNLDFSHRAGWAKAQTGIAG